jgi:hypothetical protein
MGAVSSFLKPLKENMKYRLRWRYLWKDWFLGRHACLGYDVLKHFDNLPTEVNFQKGRTDLLLSYWGDKSLLPKSSLLAPFMARKDVLPLIRQLEFFDCLPKNPPKFIFMDSFSELTDQLFFDRAEGWRFACGYSDIKQSEDFNTAYAGMGLLRTEDLEKYYIKLFSLFENRWGKVPIYFLHFPIALEKRNIFKTRYSAIMMAIDTISNSQGHIYSVKIDESKVTHPSDLSDALKDFPYHYDRNTYFEFAKLIDLN